MLPCTGHRWATSSGSAAAACALVRARFVLQALRISPRAQRLAARRCRPAETDEGFSDAQLAELADREADVDERMREIQRIAKSVSDLAKMFSELSVLIVEQGTILDRIDHNMDMAVGHVEDGVKNLVTAEGYQKSARPIICMTILMVLIVVCVIIIVVKASQKTG